MLGLDPSIHVFIATKTASRQTHLMGGWLDIMTNRPNVTFYVGVTNDLARRAGGRAVFA